MMPFWFLRARLHRDNELNSKTIWHILLGHVDIKMNYLYDMEEIWERLKEKY